MSKRKLTLILTLAVSLLLPLQAAAADDELLQGIEYFNNAQYSEAYSSLNQLESKFRSNAEFQYYYGLSLLMTDDTKQALEIMKQAIKLEPDNPDYHYALARIYEARAEEVSVFRVIGVGRSYKAALRRTLDLSPQHVGAIRALASASLDVMPPFDDKKTGYALLTRLKELDAASAASVEGRLENGKNFALAEELFLTAINTPGTSSSPGSSVAIRARTDLGLHYILNKQYSEAIPYLQQALSVPRDWTEITEAFKAPMLLAAAYYSLNDQSNFGKYALEAEIAAVFERDRKALKNWFNYYDIKYEFKTFR